MRGDGRALGVGLRMAVVVVGILLTVLMAVPASASASSFDCSGGTVYSLQRPNSQSSSTSGIVFGLQTSTLDGSSVTATQVTALPDNSYANALGVTGDGSHMYAVQQSGSAGSATVWAYDSSTGTWAPYSASGGTPSGFVAGAVDPVNGIYYYADYTAGTASTPGTATLYGFNTNTNTPIAGAIATFPLPDGNSSLSQNGDFAFDQSGNLYVLASTGATRALGVVKAPLPATGSGTTMTDTTLSSVSDSSTYNGIAFDATGTLYLESSTSGGTWQITGVDPNDGAIVSGPTPISASEQSGSAADVDLASCPHIPTLSAGTDVTGRNSTGDQFTLSITGGTITQGNTATTSGSSAGVQSESAGPVIATAGTTYTISETAASGSMSNYAVSYSCVDTANGDAPVTSGSGSSVQLTYPATSSPSVVCTFVTSPKADLALTDTASASTVAAGGQVTFTEYVANNGPDDATGVGLTDALPTGLTVVSATPTQGTCTMTSGVDCALGSVANGSSAQVDIVADVSAAASAGSVSDTATVTANETDPVAANNTASATIQITSAPVTVSPAPPVISVPAPIVVTPPTPASQPAPVDIEISTHTDHQSARLGQMITYRITVTNNGPGTAPNVDIDNAVATGLRVVSAKPTRGTCRRSGSVACRLGSLAPGGTVTITIHAIATAPGGQTLDASATVRCDGTGACPQDTNSKGDASTATTWARAYLKLLQTADRDTIAAGDETQLHLKVLNPTAARIHNVAVCERLPLGLAYVRSSVRMHLRDGRFCWNLGTLAGRHSQTIVLVVRGLSGPQRTVQARAAAGGAGVRTVRAVQHVRIVPAQLPGEAEVTG